MMKNPFWVKFWSVIFIFIQLLVNNFHFHPIIGQLNVPFQFEKGKTAIDRVDQLSISGQFLVDNFHFLSDFW